MSMKACVLCLLAVHVISVTKSFSVAPQLATQSIHPFCRDLGIRNTFSRLKSSEDDLYVVPRHEFPGLYMPEGGNLIYFDNAATTQKPRAVLESMLDYYTTFCSNVHRSNHQLGSTATARYEAARENVARFINANSASEIVFTSGATESINLVANTWCRNNVKEGDSILISLSEHNSNIIPWQLHSQNVNCNVSFIKLRDDGSIDLEDYKRLLCEGNVKLVSVAHASNVIGKVQELKPLITLAHEHGAKILIDACQTLAHVKVDVIALDCDFLVASAHKIYGPTGIGFLYAKKPILESMPPWKGGGGMIKGITRKSFVLEDVPHRFESGTPQIAQSIGFSAGLDFLNSVGLEKIAAHERMLMTHLHGELSKIATVYSPPVNINIVNQCPILSFNVEGVNPFDLATLLSTKNIAIRAGKHCAHILHEEHLKVDQTLRASLAMYNTKAEVEAFIHHLTEAVNILKGMTAR